MLSITLEVLFAAYATGLRDIPNTAAMGCVTDSLDENQVEADSAAGVIGVETAATVLGQPHFVRSTLVWVRDLYVAGFGNSLGQLTARWSTKNFLHFTQPLLSFKSFCSVSSSLGHCLQGAKGAVGAWLLLFGTRCEEGSV